MNFPPEPARAARGLRIVVTGAGGFVGRAVCPVLRDAGHEVRALRRDADGGYPPAAPFEGADAVLHLAGENVAGLWTARKRRAIETSRILGTRRLVEGMRRASSPPAMLLCASAVGYYGDRGEETLVESSAPGSGFLAGVCREWEAEAARAEEAGIRVTSLRFGLVLGAGGGALGAQLTPFRLGLGGPLGGGRQWWPWVHRQDLAGAVLHLLRHPGAGAVNVVSPAPVRQRDWAKTLAAQLRRPALLPAPAWALRLALGGFAGELLGSRKAAPRRLLQLGYAFRFARLEDALRDLLAPPAAAR